jgi:hypothetical protein
VLPIDEHISTCLDGASETSAVGFETSDHPIGVAKFAGVRRNGIKA